MSQENNSGPDQASRSFVCWSRDYQAQYLQMELEGQELLLLPYRHLDWVFFKSEKTSDLLQLSFSTHLVHIPGRNLYELAQAFRKNGVDWVRITPKHYVELALPGGVVIESIRAMPR